MTCPEIVIQRWAKPTSPSRLNTARPAWEMTTLSEEKENRARSAFLSSESDDWAMFCGDSPVSVIIASANHARKCSSGCNMLLSETFCMPDFWWKDHRRQGNGTFGCEWRADDDDEGEGHGQLGFNSWALFQSKDVLPHPADTYFWRKTNVFARWRPDRHQTAILFFDVEDHLSSNLRGLIHATTEDHLADPFWLYASLCEHVVHLSDLTITRLRHPVRNMEKREMSVAQPNYREISDLARHAIHITETLQVAVQTLDAMLSAHEQFRPSDPPPSSSTGASRSTSSTTSRPILGNPPSNAQSLVWLNVHWRLQSLRTDLINLSRRSDANGFRATNEIQLALTFVSHWNARAATIDSAAMKTVATLTLIFLPPTFISTLFSMSFFNFDAKAGWSMSGMFWIYWVIAAPLTFVTYLWWDHFSTQLKAGSVMQKVAYASLEATKAHQGQEDLSLFEHLRRRTRLVAESVTQTATKKKKPSSNHVSESSPA